MADIYHAELAPIVQEWASGHPREVEAMNRLHEADIPFGVFSSTVSALVARALDRPLRRPPDDIDLLVHPEHFEATADILDAHVMEDVPIQIETGDGLTLRFRADEAVAYGDGNTLPFQFLRPRGPIEADSHSYNTRFTSTITESGLTVVETDQGMVQLADPVETLAMQAIMRRCGNGKNDAANAVLLSGVQGFEGDYAGRRAAEIGLDDRTDQFIRWAGKRAALLSTDEARVLEVVGAPR